MLPVSRWLYVVGRLAKNQLARSRMLRRVLKKRRARASGPMHQLDYVVGVYENHARRLQELPGFAFEGLDVLELGPGRSLALGVLLLAKGARSYSAIDTEHLAEEGLSGPVYQELRELLKREKTAPLAEPDPIDRLLDGAGPLLGSRLHYLLVRPGERLPLADRGVDLVLSQAVLEHVDDIEGALAEIRRVLRPGGWMSHEVDLRDHHHDEPFDFLRYPDRLWQWMTSRSFAWTNRLRVSDYLGAVERAGLEPVQLDATLLPRQRLPAEALAGRFRGYSSYDLSCSGFHLVARRPAEPV